MESYPPSLMYMRITMGRTRPGSWSQFEAAYRQYVEANAAPGLRARWLVRSVTDADTFFTVSLWERLEDLETYERSDAVQRQVLKHIAPHLSGISTAHHCRVRGELPTRVEDLAALFTATEHRHGAAGLTGVALSRRDPS